MNIKHNLYFVFDPINAILVTPFKNILNKFYMYGLNTNKHRLKAQKTSVEYTFYHIIEEA